MNSMCWMQAKSGILDRIIILKYEQKIKLNGFFCGGTFNGGITPHKLHLVGGHKNVKWCTFFLSEHYCKRLQGEARL